MDKSTIEIIEMLKEQMDTLFQLSQLGDQRITLIKESVNTIGEIIHLQQEEIKDLQKRIKKLEKES